MELTLLFDHRFYSDGEGKIFSSQNYNYSLFANRYLKVFDRIRILARVSKQAKNRSGEHANDDGVEIVSLGDWNGPIEFLRKRPAILRLLKENLLKDTAFIMIAPGTIGSLAYPQLVESGHPYAVEVVGDPFDMFAPGSISHPLRPFFRWWFPRQLRQQCANACAAAYVTEHTLQQRYPSFPGGIASNYSSIELPQAAIVSAPRPYRQKAESHALVTVGTLAQLYKAPDVLIDAVAACVHEGLDLKLVLVGDGKHRSELQARVSTLGLGERVTFLGQLPAGDAIRSQLDQADLFVLPSRQEGLPRAMIEAMARALPCIGSTIGGIPELLSPEDMVPPNNVPALARKIREVINDPTRMARMSERNLETAKRYQNDVLQQRRITFYEHVRRCTQEYLGSQGR